ncbi:zinc-binding domain-containing protein [Rutstroemia sp. NJR-2017a BVV2]|nr:zinc-binding domain-containing protein [Rutstroemia sp. NJR-2017a BVV2]
MPSKRRRSPHKWSLYPSLHDTIAPLLQESHLHFSFHPTDDAETCIKDYDTNIMGRFTCHNSACSSAGWASKRIAITIRLYHGAKYNGKPHNTELCEGCRADHCSGFGELGEEWL